jgi:hypothetical protein
MFSDTPEPAANDDGLSPDQRLTLEQARRLVANGQPGQAAPMFSKLAEILAAGNRPRRSANLHAQAAHAFADSHNEAASLAQARAALTLFLQLQMVQRAPVFYGNIHRKLVNRGMTKAAEALANEFASKIGPLPTQAPPSGRQVARLPTNCPKCGAPVRSQEVNWIDTITAECDYCGSLIRLPGD